MKKVTRLAPYVNQIICTCLFILIAILFMWIGFWKTVILILFGGTGFALGVLKDKQRSISSIIASIQAFFER
ncbi:DUF2273 domain-containing protein [Enterococcus sp. LJL99]